MAPLACLVWPNPPANAAALLHGFSPHVATRTGLGAGPQAALADMFVLDASGLQALYGSQAAWGQALLAATRSPLARLWLGFHGWALCLLTLAQGGRSVPLRILASPAEEQGLLLDLALTKLHLAPAALATAQKLGFARLGDLAGLSVGDIACRLGPKLAQAVAQLRRPGPKIAYPRQQGPFCCRWQTDAPSQDTVQLGFVGQQLLGQALAAAVARRQRLETLRWTLHRVAPAQGHARPPPLTRQLRTAAPSNDVKIWGQLLRLWLGTLAGGQAGPKNAGELLHGVDAVTLEAVCSAQTGQQQSLWRTLQPGRDPAAAHAALAKVRALWGEDAVALAVLRPHHLPEQRFAWRPLPPQHALQPQNWDPGAALRADPLRLGRLPRVRRVWPVPQPLPALQAARLRRLPVLQSPLLAAPAAQIRPFLPAFRTQPISYSLGWWHQAQDRDYLYAILDGSQLGWLYFCRHSQQFFQHGVVD